MARVPLSRLMRVKRLTGLLPAIISTALQVSLKPVASCCLRCQPAWGATSLSVLSWLPESSQRLVLGLFLHLIAVIQAAVLVGEWRGRLTSLRMPFPTPPSWSFSLCLRSGSAASLGGRLETAAAGCHSDGAFAQPPSNSAALAEVGREKNIPGRGHHPPPGSKRRAGETEARLVELEATAR